MGFEKPSDDIEDQYRYIIEEFVAHCDLNEIGDQRLVMILAIIYSQLFDTKPDKQDLVKDKLSSKKKDVFDNMVASVEDNEGFQKILNHIWDEDLVSMLDSLGIKKRNRELAF